MSKCIGYDIFSVKFIYNNGTSRATGVFNARLLILKFDCPAPFSTASFTNNVKIILKKVLVLSSKIFLSLLLALSVNNFTCFE